MKPLRISAPAFALTACALLLAGCESPQFTSKTLAPSTPGTGRTIVWRDEFDGTAGTSPSAGLWSFDVGTDWGNSQLEYDTARPTNVSLDGQGHLAIVARKESFAGQPYTSGRITTRGLFSQTHGRFEARILLPKGRGIWPAFWLLGNDIGTNGWPTCGEIDVMELRGQEPGTIHGSLHGPGYSGGGALTRSFTLPSGTFDGGYHVFAIEWKANSIVYSVDGLAYQTLTPSSLPPNSRWVFEHPFFIILNLAVGGNYVGSPDGTTTFPQTMLVDYVRVYSSL